VTVRWHFGCVFVLLFAVIDPSAQTARPPGLPGELFPPTLEAEAPKTDLLVTGLRIANDFDDNALDDNHHKQPNVVTVIEPHLGWNLSHPRLEWSLDYSPGFSISRPLQNYDSRSHLLDTVLRLRLTKRFEISLRNSFLTSKNPFDRLRQSELMPGFGILDRPSDSILAPTARRTSEQAGLDLTYALDRHTIIGASGSFFSVKYSSAAGTQLPLQFLEDTSSMNGHAFYSHHLTPSTWVGFDYNVQRLIVRSSQSRALVQSVFYTDTVSFTPNITVSVFAGPERSATHDDFPLLVLPLEGERISRSNWHWAGGATYNWSGAHTGIVASIYRKIGDGGGVLGVAKLSGATLEFRRQLARQWTVDLLASYEDNKALSGTSRALTYVSATGGLTRMLSQSTSLEFRYWRVHLSSNSAQVGTYLADHNRVSMSLIYDLKHPLGR